MLKAACRRLDILFCCHFCFMACNLKSGFQVLLFCFVLSLGSFFPDGSTGILKL